VIFNMSFYGVNSASVRTVRYGNDAVAELWERQVQTSWAMSECAVHYGS